MKFRRANVSAQIRAASPGFTLLELAIVIFIMGLMLTLTMPYIGGFRRAALRSQARRLAGRATYLFDQAAGPKLVLRQHRSEEQTSELHSHLKLPSPLSL